VNDQPTFWFPAKRYGWGWGLPVRWQGWLVLIGYFGLLFAGLYYFKQRQAASSLWLYVAVLTVVLIAIVALKGERRLRWRWGRE
jgi:Tfp pilus assembly protein PilN